jgi:hypothetical protein
MYKDLRVRGARFLALNLLALAVLATPARAQDKAAVAPGGAVNVTVTAGVVPPPPVSITLRERHGHVTPDKGKCTHTGGGLIDVANPAPDTVIITMSGAVVANADMRFELEQSFEVSFDDPKLKRAKLTVEGRVIGVLRGGKKGSADYSDACAHVTCGPAALLSVCVPPHSVSGCDNLSVNDHDGPKAAPVVAGTYTLNQTFTVSAHSGGVLCKRPSAEFAPDPALDPLWISYHEPFHGVKKDTFGFQVVIKVAPDTEPVPVGKRDGVLLPAPGRKSLPSGN